MNLAPRSLLSLIGGLVALVVAIVGAYYMLFIQAKTPAVAATPQTYPVTVLTDIAQPGGLLDKIGPLHEVQASQPSSVTYSSGDLGKTDITKVE